MKNLFLGVLVVMTLFAATSLAQQGPFSITQPLSDEVVAISGDISCVFFGPTLVDDDFVVNCFTGKTFAYTETFHAPIGTCDENGKNAGPGTAVQSEFGPTGDGNNIQWQLCQPTRGAFTWSVNVDNGQATGSGTFHI